MRILLAVVFLLLSSGVAQAWTASYSWAPATGATSYKVEKSVDNGATWTVVSATLASPTLNYTGSEAALVLFRVSNCNSNGCTVRPGDGWWHNEGWTPPPAPASLAVQ